MEATSLLQHTLGTQILYEIIWIQNIDCKVSKGWKKEGLFEQTGGDWFPIICMQNEISDPQQPTNTWF